MNRIRFMNVFKWVFGAGVIFFSLHALWVVFLGGFRIEWGSFVLRSTTIEFPVLFLFISIVLFLLCSGKPKEAGLFLGSVVFTCVVGEAVLRVVDHPMSMPHIESWYEPSDVFGWQLAADFEGKGPLGILVRTNSHHFRDVDHQWEKASHTLRILALGDSFTFGWGVPLEATFLKQLEDRLQQRMRKRVETISSGVPGWGLNQYYRYLKHVGLTYDPDVIILAYFVDDLPTSFQETIAANPQYKPGVQFKGGTLSHSRLANFTKAIADQIRDRNRYKRVEYLYDLPARRKAWSQREHYLYTADGGERTKPYYRLLDEFLRKFRDLAKLSHAHLIVMFIPDVSQLYHPEMQHINRVLAKTTRSMDIPFLDMTPIFETGTDPSTYYLIPRDSHTNPRGHLAMAKALTPMVCEAIERVGTSCLSP